MPGIAGVISKNPEQNKSLLELLVQPLMYHPWYKDERLYKENAAISHIHTGILKNKMGFNVCIHGEIYNDDLGNQDQTEYVSNLYKQQGKDFAAYLNGSFSILLFDEEQSRIYLATDRIASKPVIYYHNSEFFVFAPELKSILAVLQIAGVKVRANMSAVADVLTNSFITGCKTLVEDVFLLERASVLELKGNSINKYRYWEYRFNEDMKDLGRKYYQENLSILLRQAVDRRIRSDHKYGLLLTGGFDSRGILGCCLSKDKIIDTFTYGAKKIRSSDPVIAEALSEKVRGLKNIYYPLDIKKYLKSIQDSANILDGMGNAIEEWPFYRTIRERYGIQILLCGERCFGWYDVFLEDEEAMFATLDIYLMERFSQHGSILKKEYFDLLCEASRQNMARLSETCKMKDLHNRKDFFYLDQRLARLINPWRYAISTEVEVRNPWLDNDVLDFVASFPEKYRRGRRLYKLTLRSMFPDLFQIEMEKNPALFDRSMFLHWLRSYKQPILKSLVDGELPIDRIFNRKKLEELLCDQKINFLNSIIFFSRSLSPKFFSVVKEVFSKTRYGFLLRKSIKQHVPIQQVISRIIRLRQALGNIELGY